MESKNNFNHYLHEEFNIIQENMVYRTYRKNAKVQNIQGKGLEIHYKRMSDRHQMFALKNSLRSWPLTGRGSLSPSKWMRLKELVPAIL